MRNPYEVLGVTKEATTTQVKVAFRRIAADNHPDRNKGSIDVFQEAQAAYEILGDPSKRAAFDRGTARAQEVAAAVENQAYAEATNLFGQLCNVISPDQIQFLDVKKNLIGALKEVRNNNEQSMRTAKAQLRKLKLLKRRLKGGEFIFLNWIQEQRRKNIAAARQARHTKRVIKRTEELFNTIDFDFTHVQQFNMGTATGASFF